MKKLLLLLLLVAHHAHAAQPKIIAYYTGTAERLAQFPLEKLSHIIYSFVQLRNDSLMLRDAEQEKNVKAIVALKKKYPQLKIMVSMGGWSGCAPCSDLFADAQHRKTFAQTTIALLTQYHLDGIDLDWEYPAIEGFPGHKYEPADRDHFTALIHELRQALGKQYLLSFAAGGFEQYLDNSIDWARVTPEVDFINLMTYDLVGGYATVTGHHTPLYSYRPGQASTDACVTWLLQHHVPANKLITGAAFYARVWEKVADNNHGLYQTGVFKEGVDYAQFGQHFSDSSGFQYYWDEKAQAPYRYDAAQHLFATFDDERSIAAKAEYVRKQHLGGIMFWELVQDKNSNGLVDVLWRILKAK